jgi:cell division protein FtsQ
MDKRYRKTYPAYNRHSVSPKQVNRSRRVLLAALLVLVLIWAFLGFIRSDFFRIEAIEVRGNLHTEENEIRLAMPLQEGDNIWRMNPAYLEGRITEIPRIEHAFVSRRLPRKVLVEVTEKKPLALIPYQQYLLEIGADGMVLGSTEERQNYNLPLLTGMPPTELTVGKILLEGVMLEEIREVITAMVTAGIAVSEFNMADEDNVIVITMDGMTVWLGRNNYAKKADLIVQIIRQLDGRQTEGYLDLRVLSAPAFHPTGEEATKNN